LWPRVVPRGSGAVGEMVMCLKRLSVLREPASLTPSANHGAARRSVALGNAERSAIAFAKHQVADADAGGLADALALALLVYFRCYSHYCRTQHEIRLGSGMDTRVPGRVSGCDHCKL